MTLRPFCEEDLEILAGLKGEPETMRYISPPLPREIVAEILVWTRREWKRLGFGWFAVFERETGTFVGQCGLQGMEGGGLEEEVAVSFVISSPFWGKGYATEAARAVLTFGFSRAGLSRILAITVDENISSKRVLEKLGFTLKGKKNLHHRPFMVYSLEKKHYRPSET